MPNAVPPPDPEGEAESEGQDSGRGAVGFFFKHLGRVTAAGLSWIRKTIAQGIIRARIPANVITLTGPIALLLLFIPMLEGDLVTAGLVVLLGGAFDTFDGAVARISGRVTRFGAYLDSVMDRYADALLLFGLLVFLLRHLSGPTQTLYLTLWGLATLGTMVTSYAKARAETMVPQCVAGFMERPERTSVVFLALLAGNFHIGLWFLAFFCNLIAIQRIFFTRAMLAGRESVPAFRYWTYRRGSAEHAALSLAIILSLIFGHLAFPPPV